MRLRFAYVNGSLCWFFEVLVVTQFPTRYTQWNYIFMKLFSSMDINLDAFRWTSYAFLTGGKKKKKCQMRCWHLDNWWRIPRTGAIFCLFIRLHRSDCRSQSTFLNFVCYFMLTVEIAVIIWLRYCLGKFPHNLTSPFWIISFRWRRPHTLVYDDIVCMFSFRHAWVIFWIFKINSLITQN